MRPAVLPTVGRFLYDQSVIIVSIAGKGARIFAESATPTPCGPSRRMYLRTLQLHGFKSFA
ncbi:MAG: hypothetical protein AAF624_17080, partial [Bacteroidota bacterium]